jgi:hypothetical protein
MPAVMTALVELPAAQVAASTAEWTEEAVGGRCVHGCHRTDCHNCGIGGDNSANRAIGHVNGDVHGRADGGGASK